VDDRRLTAEASFYVAIQTVVARIQFAANEPEQSENHYGSGIIPQNFVDIVSNKLLVVFVWLSERGAGFGLQPRLMQEMG